MNHQKNNMKLMITNFSLYKLLRDRSKFTIEMNFSKKDKLLPIFMWKIETY